MATAHIGAQPDDFAEVVLMPGDPRRAQFVAETYLTDPVVVNEVRGMTEVDGRIYSLATTSPNNSQERIAQESEKVIQSLQRGNRPSQAGLKQ